MKEGKNIYLNTRERKKRMRREIFLWRFGVRKDVKPQKLRRDFSRFLSKEQIGGL